MLGTLALRSDGTDRTPRGLRQRRLCAALVSARGATVTVERLAQLIWPEGVANPRASIKVLVSRVRRTGGIPIQTRVGGYALEVQDATIDVAIFESLLAAARTRTGQERLERLDEALALWRGSPFPELADDLDIEAEVARLTELHLTAEEDRAEALLAMGRATTAAADLAAGCAREPLRSRRQGLLMRALHLSGQSAQAVRVYQQHRVRLRDETGLEPSPELARLEYSILTAGAGTDPEAAAAPRPDRSFVGRVTELIRIEGDLAVGVTVVVEGEPGIGKSALVEVVRRRHEEAGGRAWCGACDMHLRVPHRPFVEMLAGTTVERALAGRDEDARPEGTSMRWLLFEQVRRELENRSPDALVIVEDIHWADPGTIDLIDHLLVRAPDLRFILTTRLAEADGALRQLGMSARALGLDRIRLEGLNTDEVASLVGPGADADTLERRSGGNPLYLRELHARGGANAALTDLIAARVQELGDPAATILSTAAVLGIEFDFDAVCDLVPADPASVASALDRASRVGLLEPPRQDSARLRFHHAVVAEALPTRLAPMALARTHQRAARIAGARGRSAAEVAHHWERALPVAPVDAVVAAFIAAGHEADRASASTQAAAWYARASALLEATQPVDAARILDCRIAEAAARLRAGDRSSPELLNRCAAQAREIGDPERLAAVALAGRRSALSSDGRRANRTLIALLEEALSGNVSATSRALMAAHLAGELDQHRDRAGARARAAEALAVSATLGDDTVRARVLHNVFHVLRAPDTEQLLPGLVRELTVLAERLDDPFLRFGGAWQSFQVALIDLDHVAAEAAFARAEAADRAVGGSPFTHWGFLATAVLHDVISGDLVNAQRHLDEATEAADRAHMADGTYHVALQGAWIAFERGDVRGWPDRVLETTPELGRWSVLPWEACVAAADGLPEARTLLRDGVEYLCGAPHDHKFLMVASLLAESAGITSDEWAASKLLRLLAPYADRLALAGISCHLPVNHWLGVLHRVCANLSASRLHLERASTMAGQLRAPTWQARTAVEQWRTALVAGEPDADELRVRARARCLEAELPGLLVRLDADV